MRVLECCSALALQTLFDNSLSEQVTVAMSWMDFAAVALHKHDTFFFYQKHEFGSTTKQLKSSILTLEFTVNH